MFTIDGTLAHPSLTSELYEVSPNVNTSGPFYEHGSPLNQSWIINYTHYKVCDEITFHTSTFRMDK